MKITPFLILIILLPACNDIDNNQKLNKKANTSDTIETIVNNDIDTLTPWTIEVINFKYSINDLYGFWKHSDEPKTKEPLFEIDKNGFHLLKGPTHQYLINYDTIRISDNHEGNFSVGQITLAPASLTKCNSW